MADDEDDPVIASYDVYLTEPPNSKDASSKLYVLQYPSHRPYWRPYDAATSQTPTSLRLKPDSGFVEIDVPILTHEYYNEYAGERFGKAVAEGRTMQAGGSHGLAGGFSAGSTQSRFKDVPMHDQPASSAPYLTSQTLGGKMVAPSTRDPIYLVGCFKQNQIHLSHVDSVVQMRPQLHHIDAEDEVSQKRLQSANAAGLAKQKPGLEAPTPKVESKAIELKIRDNKDDAKDRGLNENARLLRDIQVEEWQHHDWVNEDESESKTTFGTHLQLPSDVTHVSARLRSIISNGDWLDRISAPREDGKKGLLAKLRGRERERARRKKAEEEKRQRLKEATGGTAASHGALLGMSSDSDLSTPEPSDSEADEDVTLTGAGIIDRISVKDEPPAISMATVGTSGPAATAHTAPKKRGRPRKNQEAIQVDE
ncbi:hypothetical protein A1O3_05024 [Capronia epimyces CBS 606.96]|uniref:DNA-directed RNA polymerase III subunit RPC5 n=1 Tax=Capronia epimyces CBS 606.96 TaxID=1182542 RepID=W9XV01_9EURO|nr:uncharacterized protein A1O3_05024 [Capronia epimyces CBS 606.96]EXJ84357.1 hypothetical protein A1O3_05024 [Capronia epimyces CBS 606.96]